MAATVSLLRRVNSAVAKRAPALCAMARAGSRLRRSVRIVKTERTMAPASAATPSQGWIRKQMARKIGVHGKSTMAVGPGPVRNERIWSRSRTGWCASVELRFWFASRISESYTDRSSRRSSIDAIRTTSRERTTSSPPWNA